MKNRSGTKLVGMLASFLVLSSAPAQDSLRGTLKMGTADLARIKENAEAGDAAAQVISRCRNAARSASSTTWKLLFTFGKHSKQIRIVNLLDSGVQGKEHIDEKRQLAGANDEGVRPRPPLFASI